MSPKVNGLSQVISYCDSENTIFTKNILKGFIEHRSSFILKSATVETFSYENSVISAISSSIVPVKTSTHCWRYSWYHIIWTWGDIIKSLRIKY